MVQGLLPRRTVLLAAHLGVKPPVGGLHVMAFDEARIPSAFLLSEHSFISQWHILTAVPSPDAL